MEPVQALRGLQHSAPVARPEPALLLGAGGWLGAALLAQLSGSGAFARVGAWVSRPLSSSHRGVIGVEKLDALDPVWQGACAFVVLERDGLVGARDAVFRAPKPEQLLDLARQLLAGGVRRLVVLMPHLPGSLPAALQQGFADQLEQALSELDFAQLLLVRSSRAALGPPPGTPWLQRVADAWWAQLRWMLPDAERPLRSVALARVVVTAARLLREHPGRVHLLPQPAASRAAHAPEGIEAALRAIWHFPPSEAIPS